MLRSFTEMADIADVTGPEGEALLAEFNTRLDDLPKAHSFMLLLLRNLQSARTLGLRYRQRLQLARLGLRIDRYRTEHGRLPEKLEEVLDGRMREVPVGIFSGGPLVYRVMRDGFSIQNLGPNGKDDGIDTTSGKRKDEHEGDFRVRYSELETGEAQ